MASAFAHAAAGAALWPLFRHRAGTQAGWVAGALLAVAPDLDVIGFRFGVAYGDLLGHRGLTHSLLVALLVGTALGYWLARHEPERRRWLAAYLVLALASHGLLDTLTTGGLGVALLSPLSTARWFAPWRPIAVSPLGLRPFFTRHGLAILANEAVWVGIPSAIVAAIGLAASRRAGRPLRLQ